MKLFHHKGRRDLENRPRTSANGSLWVGLGDLGHSFAYSFRLPNQVIGCQTRAKVLEAFFRRVYDFEKIEILLRNRTRIRHGLEIDDAVPVLAAIDDHKNLFGQFLGLWQGKDFEEFVHRSKATRENYQRLGKVREPELAHKEVVKLEIERRSDIRVRRLLKRKIDIKPDGLAASLMRTQVRSLHDSWAATCGYDKTMPAGGNLN